MLTVFPIGYIIHQYEVGVTEHDTYSNHEMYVGDVVIPEVVTFEGVTYRVSEVCNNAFWGSTYLHSISIPSTVSFIDYVGNTFQYCTHLESILVSPGNEAYCDLDGVLFSKDMSTLVAYPSGRTGHYDVPAGVQQIGVAAFYQRRGLISVTLPESLNEIKVNAFTECNNMTTVTSRSPTPPQLAWSPNDIYVNVFGLTKPDTLRVPRVAIEAYRNAVEWNQFANILPIAGDYDITGDGIVDVADVNWVIDMMLHSSTPCPSPGGEGSPVDVNGDGVVDIADVNVIINAMLGKD